jgi:hypothetical protein
MTTFPVIRREQMRALGAPGRALFEQTLIEKARRFFPSRTGEMSESELYQAAGYAMRRASDYGLAMQADVAKYFYLTLVLGKDFDIDPAYAWAARILRSRQGSPALNFRRLYCEAIERVSAGPPEPEMFSVEEEAVDAN